MLNVKSSYRFFRLQYRIKVANMGRIFLSVGFHKKE